MLLLNVYRNLYSVWPQHVHSDKVLMMKKLIEIVVLGLLLNGCVTTEELTSQKNNPYKVSYSISTAKDNSNVKISSQREN